MPRSRSRSPKRTAERRRSRSRSRERRRRPRRSRSRSPPPRYRSRSPARRRSRSHSRSPRRRSPSPRRRSKEREGGGRSSQAEKKPTVVEKPKIDETQLAGLSEEDREMMSLMGFANFDTTKNKKVEGNDLYSANIVRKRRYRQYMNRRGGFNRPLDFIA